MAARKLITAATKSTRLPGKEAVIAFSGNEPAPQEQQLTQEQLDIGLQTTSTPGVYVNGAGVMVDGDGVMLEYADVKIRDQQRFEKIIGGPVDTPAKLLKAVTLDPQLPLPMRIDAAKAAAPYFDRKKPIGIDGGEDGSAIQIQIMHKLQIMPQADLDHIEKILRISGTDAEIEMEI